jgi:hypothetical protein
VVLVWDFGGEGILLWAREKRRDDADLPVFAAGASARANVVDEEVLEIIAVDSVEAEAAESAGVRDLVGACDDGGRVGVVVGSVAEVGAAAWSCNVLRRGEDEAFEERLEFGFDAEWAAVRGDMLAGEVHLCFSPSWCGGVAAGEQDLHGGGAAGPSGRQPIYYGSVGAVADCSRGSSANRGNCCRD